MATSKLNLKIVQGATFSQTFRWESSVKGYKPVSAILKQAPMVILSANHGIPAGWRTKITGLSGMKEVNPNTYYIISAVTSDSITINDVNSTNFTDYITGGILEYNIPVDLTGYTARMQIREKITSSTITAEATTESGGIIINNDNKTISINLSATTTAAFTFKTAVYSLELIKNSIVTSLVDGTLTLEKEVTR